MILIFIRVCILFILSIYIWYCIYKRKTEYRQNITQQREVHFYYKYISNRKFNVFVNKKKI